MKKKVNSGVETAEEFIARGGKITVYPQGATGISDVNDIMRKYGYKGAASLAKKNPKKEVPE